jgi:hypothetical protein
VAIKCVHGDVRLRAEKPLVMDAILVEHLAPRF